MDAYEKFGAPRMISREVSKWIEAHGDALMNVVSYESTGMSFAELVQEHHDLQEEVKKLRKERDDNQLFG